MGPTPCLCKPFAGDPKFIMKILLDSIDKKDLKKKEVEEQKPDEVNNQAEPGKTS